MSVQALLCSHVCLCTRCTSVRDQVTRADVLPSFPHFSFSKREELGIERLDHPFVRTLKPIDRGPENVTAAPVTCCPQDRRGCSLLISCPFVEAPPFLSSYRKRSGSTGFPFLLSLLFPCSGFLCFEAESPASSAALSWPLP